MTKREICERLLAIWEMEPYKNTAEAIKHLLLDLAAPEEHFADAGKMVREEDEMPRCPKCGDFASFTCGTPDEPDSFGRCYKCGVSFPLKRREDR